MIRYILKRILQVVPLLLVISFIVFTLIHLAPYDAIDAQITSNMSQEEINILREQSGLNKPFLIQYVDWLGQILSGNFGHSLVTHNSVGEEILAKIPNTISLVLPAYVTALVIAIVLGLLAAANKGKWQDKLIDAVASLGIATPSFWIAMIFIYVLGYQLNLFPIIGMHTIGKEGDFGDLLSHFVMPYLTLTIVFFAELTRYVRSSALSQTNEEYVVVQQAFQATKTQVFTRHIIKNVLIPVITQVGMSLPMLVTGAIITETVFSWPGIGPYITQATRALDYPIIMAVMLLSATLVIVGNLISDILYSIVDPRIRRGGK
ncbi:ABC transporter permease [Gemella haemolysans]|uniref:ABC transporter, permease protein n=1 Tax=Gemella haemolysans ATCC 10379 TaxID=546270 RepID=C5NW20_9BACL|nr:ABC transporter permease [Gemella haemolysans]EER68616.1 ABC transporter, permease protein [Gemella haemolysans ATCC 10379]KAA8708252.1 ABC transporter permease [Gemella haemolysans]UBH82454.1 ABC transporter permease [Gemella haemolysans]VEI39305.1 Glutathione transport system permease protein gsiC [Gemella haemolysans]